MEFGPKLTGGPQGLLGMNLFVFQTTNGGFRISRDFWVFVALTLPLTAFTILTWRLVKSRQDKERRLARQKEKEA
jgi:hypothetical protein